MTAKKPIIWIGRFKFGKRTIYAATAASTRKRCQELIDEGPFYNTEPLKWLLTPAPTKKCRADGKGGKP